MRQLEREQFFTIDENVNFCLSKLNLSIYDSIIEPSAGGGAFSLKIPNCIALDIEPQHKDIIKQDYLLEFDYNDFLNKDVLVVGNPPFGKQSKLAIQFINKSAKYAKRIAFILPKSFKKESVINKLDKHIHVNSIYDLPNNNFLYENKKCEVPCVFVIFDVKDEIRPRPIKYHTDDFSFVKQDVCDCSIRRVGVNAGRLESKDANPASHYFIKWHNELAKDIINRIKWPHDNTAGPRSLSQNEIIKTYLDAVLDNRN